MNETTTITCARCEREGIVWADADGREHLCSAHAADEIMGLRAAAHQDAMTVTRLRCELREMHDMRDQALDQALDEARVERDAWRKALRLVKADRDRLQAERDELEAERDELGEQLDRDLPEDRDCVL